MLPSAGDTPTHQTPVRDAIKRAYTAALSASFRRPAGIRATEPLVSFTFDDCPRSAYTNAGAILGSRGARGTYYVAAALLGIENVLGEHVGEEDLRSLITDGHEVATHTFSHVSCRSLSPSAYLSEVTKGENALHQLTNGRASTNFAYPFGAVTLAAKRAVGRHCPSCRSTVPGSNGPSADLSLLRANRLYSDSVGVDAVRHLLRRFARPGHWLVFYTHDVRDRPSAYGCTPAYFETVVRAATDAGARIVTIASALAVLGA